MRLFKTGILLFLIAKGTLGLSFAYTVSTDNCCTNATLEIRNQVATEDSELCTTTEEEKEKGCCDQNCHCICCIHVLTNITDVDITYYTNIEFREVVSHYMFSYKHLELKNIWQPPRLN